MNVTLIGMVGVGKSVLGRALARKMRTLCIDTDRLIEKKTGRKLQKLIDTIGEDRFLTLEKDTVIGLALKKASGYVISPGGSVVYSPEAMRYLRKNTKIIFLAAPLATIRAHIKNRSSRGIVGLEKKNLARLYAERLPLYKKYAHLKVRVGKNMTVNQVVDKILKSIEMCP
ncbi:MAG: shikimate kinase [Candidatus Omnitrophica bacterium]|nr:shikimate kinase [Candidatus Omnitrophota bacterium]